ncbi:MAG: DUF1127 domain-containing protein [Reyranellaceae bacterium]
MSAYTNPHLNLQGALAEARSAQAKVVRDMVVKGVRFVGSRIGALYARLRAVQKQRAAAAQLMAMDERMLQDIGLNRSLVPFVVAGAAPKKVADIYGDAGVGLTANDNSARHAA